MTLLIFNVLRMFKNICIHCFLASCTKEKNNNKEQRKQLKGINTGRGVYMCMYGGRLGVGTCVCMGGGGWVVGVCV